MILGLMNNTNEYSKTGSNDHLYYPVKKYETNIKQKCMKSKCLFNCICTSATLLCKVCLMPLKIWTIYKVMKLYKIMENHGR